MAATNSCWPLSTISFIFLATDSYREVVRERYLGIGGVFGVGVEVLFSEVG
jgi:hypothetical protein